MCGQKEKARMERNKPGSPVRGGLVSNLTLRGRKTRGEGGGAMEKKSEINH